MRVLIRLTAPPRILYLLNNINTLINLLEIGPHIRPHNIDHTRYFRHAPARLRVAANMFSLACGYVVACLLRPLWLAEGATQAGCDWTALNERVFYSRDNFKLNRAAALTEWRQLLSA